MRKSKTKNGKREKKNRKGKGEKHVPFLPFYKCIFMRLLLKK
jgi:hypothetical protein